MRACNSAEIVVTNDCEGSAAPCAAVHTTITLLCTFRGWPKWKDATPDCFVNIHFYNTHTTQALSFVLYWIQNRQFYDCAHAHSGVVAWAIKRTATRRSVSKHTLMVFMAYVCALRYHFCTPLHFTYFYFTSPLFYLNYTHTHSLCVVSIALLSILFQLSAATLRRTIHSFLFMLILLSFL